VREALGRYVASGLVAVVLVSLLGVWLFRRAGDAEAIRDAKDQTLIAAQGSVEPSLSDGLLRGDPKAIARVDRVVKERVLSDVSIAQAIARVKIWDRSGRVVYSDEPRLIGARYAMSPGDRAEFQNSTPEAAVSDLSKPENRFERKFGRLLEVYLPVQTPDGVRLRYETYYRSSFISARGRRIFRQFAPVMLGGLILLALIQLPLAWWLARRVQRGQEERERLLRSAIEASDMERRRIARDLHDGVVQDLAAVSYSLSAAAEGASAPYDSELREAAAETRHGISQLRTLLVEIYPPELHRAGLEAALADLLGASEARGIETALDVDDGLRLGRDTEALFFRVAQEAMRNVIKYADAKHVRVEVGAENGRARLLVEDDGRGFDPGHYEDAGHFGLRMLRDLARDAGGELEVNSAPGRGSRVSVEVAA
jgi:signal transduction histidine kinase